MRNPEKQRKFESREEIEYRQEIDGLRAIAVICVILNHFNESIIKSGYLGVDIFFVLSGYVITASLYRRKNKQLKDLITSFYERRIKRLFPAFILFAIVTSILTCLFIPEPKVQIGAGISSLIGLSNIFMYLRELDYFSQSSALNPFTHTWSLAVEEQFYLLFPLLFWFWGGANNLNKEINTNRLKTLFMTLSSVSLILYMYLANKDPIASYYLMPSRFWEIGAGVLTYLYYRNNKLTSYFEKINSNVLLVSLLLMMYIPNNYMQISNILTVVLTCLLLICLKKNTTAFTVLTEKTIGKVGKLSYSLYLWHWPIISLSLWTIGISIWTLPLQIFLLIGISCVSYKFVENPLRANKWFKNSIINIYIGIISILTSISIILGLNNSKLYAGQTRNFGVQGHPSKGFYISNKKQSGKTVLMLGDSHATHYLPLLKKLEEEKKATLYIHDRYSGTKFNKPSPPRYEYLIPVLNSYTNVLKVGDIIFISLSANTTGRFHLSERDKEIFDKVIEYAKSLGVNLVIVNETPYFRQGTYALCHKEWFRPAYVSMKNCSPVKRSTILGEVSHINEYYDQLAKFHNNVYVFDAFTKLCSEKEYYCKPIKNDQYIYWDANHLNKRGAEYLYPDLKRLLSENGII